MIFGEKLKTERNKNGRSQEELAEKLFVSRQSVQNGRMVKTTEALKSLLQYAICLG